MIQTPGDTSEIEDDDEEEENPLIEGFRALIADAVREISGSRTPEIIVNVPPVSLPAYPQPEPRPKRLKFTVTSRDRHGDIKEAIIEAIP